MRFQDGRAGLLNPEIKRGANESQLRIDPEQRYLVNPVQSANRGTTIHELHSSSMILTS